VPTLDRADASDMRTSSREPSTTPPIFVVFAVLGGVLFLLGGILTAMTPDDRAVLIVGAVAFSLLGVYTLVVVHRKNRLVTDVRDVSAALAAAHERDRGLRARLAVTIREPMATVVAYADRLSNGQPVDADEQRRMLGEVLASAREVDRVLADLADQGDAQPTARVSGVVRLDEELASVAASTLSEIDFEVSLDPARVWADPATIRQAFRVIIGGMRSSGCSSIALKTAQRQDVAIATLSGRCVLGPESAVDALTTDEDLRVDDDRHRSLRTAHEAIRTMGGTIGYTEALGVSHIVVELPPAPVDLATRKPTQLERPSLPPFGHFERDASLLAAADLRPERPTASLRFD
jgi:hypothetical protein